MRLLSFVRSLFRRRRSPPTTPPPAPVEEDLARAAAEVAPSPPAPAAVAETPGEPLAEDDDEWRDHEEDEDDPESGPDPFISGAAAVFELPADVEALRRQARADALSGEHKLPLSSPAGPGSLAEALNALMAEGRIEADFVDDPIEGPYMHYRPVARSA
jgi:hypothetical protein